MYVNNKKNNALNLVWLFLPSIIWSISLSSPSFCVDSLILPFLESGRKKYIKILIRIVWSIFFSVSLLMTWNIHPASYDFYLSQTLSFSPVKILIGIFFGCLIFALILILSANEFFSKKIAKFTLLTGIFLLILKTLLVYNVVTFDYARYFLRSPAMIVSKEILISFNPKKNIISYIKPTPEYTFNRFLRKKENLPPKIILMVVESWSETEKSLKEINKELNVKNINVIESGFSTYKGSTLQGELRELCSEYISLKKNLILEKSKLKCAPEYLKSRGYDVVGLHGYSGNFYARNIVWGNIGIEQKLFKKDFKLNEYCEGAFPGVCDKNLISFGLGLLSKNSLQFIYFLTLTSHEPIDSSLLLEKGSHLKNIDAKNNAQIIARRAISDLIEGLERNKEGDCTETYIVGDHQSPSVSGDISFPEEKIPYLVLSFNCKEAQASH